MTHSEEVSSRVTHSEEVSSRVTHSEEVSSRLTQRRQQPGRMEARPHLYAAVLQGRLQLQLGGGALLLVGLPHVLHGRRVDVVQLRT